MTPSKFKTGFEQLIGFTRRRVPSFLNVVVPPPGRVIDEVPEGPATFP